MKLMLCELFVLFLLFGIVGISQTGAQMVPATPPPVTQGHNFTTVDFPGASWTVAWDLNTKNNMIVGAYLLDDSTRLFRGFTLLNGTYATLELPPGAVSAGVGGELSGVGSRNGESIGS